MDLTRVLNFNSHEPDQNQGCFPSLSWNERMIGFAACFVFGIYATHQTIVGYFIQMLSFGSFISLAFGSPTKFALLYSFGNIVSLVGYVLCLLNDVYRTGFLVGFERQCRNMVDEQRKITSLVFFSSLIGTLVFALAFESKLLVFLCVMVQIPSYIWYCATYIPFARDCIKSCLRGIIQTVRGR